MKPPWTMWLCCRSRDNCPCERTEKTWKGSRSDYSNSRKPRGPRPAHPEKTGGGDDPLSEKLWLCSHIRAGILASLTGRGQMSSHSLCAIRRQTQDISSLLLTGFLRETEAPVCVIHSFLRWSYLW